jgi:hypothetical protein
MSHDGSDPFGLRVRRLAEDADENSPVQCIASRWLNIACGSVRMGGNHAVPLL